MMLRIFAAKAGGQDFTEERWRPWLSGERMEQAERRKAGTARQLFLAAEILLNRSLERVGAQVALPAAYTRNPHGKPYLCRANGLYANWSHSGDCVLCGLSDRELGVDLQLMEREPQASLVRRVLQPEERAFYERTEEARRKQLFYEYWAVKESYLKAAGTGFSTSLDAFYVNLEGPCPEVVQREEGGICTCRLLKIAEGYAAAVCVRGAKKEPEANLSAEWIEL